MKTRSFIKDNFVAIEWALGIVATLLPVLAWISRANLKDLTLYDIFPPLGLIAFGLMWTHFITGALRRYANVRGHRGGMYGSVSMGIVLALLVLHPGLFWLALYMDGYGLPPGSYIETYSRQLWLLSLGMIALFIFLAYEFKRIFGSRPWWRLIERLQIVAMLFIFVHAIGLGNELRIDWFLGIWIVFGVTLLVSVVYAWMWDNKNKGEL